MRKRFEHTCEWCGEIFLSDARPRFCSRQCAGLGKRTLPSVFCSQCKEELSSAKRAKLRGLKGSVIFCSRVCDRAYWTQHGVLAADGYIHVYTPEHPRADKRGRVLQHRLVMEKVVDRLLDPAEIVHHKNGVKTDNKPENLELLVRSTHSTGYHLSCPECGHHFSIFPVKKT